MRQTTIITTLVAVILIAFFYAWGKSWQAAPAPAPVTSGHQSIDGQVAACVNCRVEQLGDVDRYRTIHAKGSVCPAGWKLVKALFIESDLNKMDACSNPNPARATYDFDYLLAGESYPVTIELR